MSEGDGERRVKRAGLIAICWSGGLRTAFSTVRLRCHHPVEDGRRPFRAGTNASETSADTAYKRVCYRKKKAAAARPPKNINHALGENHVRHPARDLQGADWPIRACENERVKNSTRPKRREPCNEECLSGRGNAACTIPMTRRCCL